MGSLVTGVWPVGGRHSILDCTKGGVQAGYCQGLGREAPKANAEPAGWNHGRCGTHGTARVRRDGGAHRRGVGSLSHHA